MWFGICFRSVNAKTTNRKWLTSNRFELIYWVEKTKSLVNVLHNILKYLYEFSPVIETIFFVDKYLSILHFVTWVIQPHFF